MRVALPNRLAKRNWELRVKLSWTNVPLPCANADKKWPANVNNSSPKNQLAPTYHNVKVVIKTTNNATAVKNKIRAPKDSMQ